MSTPNGKIRVVPGISGLQGMLKFGPEGGSVFYAITECGRNCAAIRSMHTAGVDDAVDLVELRHGLDAQNQNQTTAQFASLRSSLQVGVW